MTIDQFINEAFAIRNQVHLWHIQTKGYAEHKALGEFYDGWLDLVDSFIETYAGKYERPTGGLSCTAIPYREDLSISYIRNVANWMQSSDLRSIAPDSDLQNILDELTSLANHTAYLLTLK